MSPDSGLRMLGESRDKAVLERLVIVMNSKNPSEENEVFSQSSGTADRGIVSYFRSNVLSNDGSELRSDKEDFPA